MTKEITNITQPLSKIVIIVPYFGRLPETFDLWLLSALHNPTIDFWFFTDNQNIKSVHNISVKHMEFFTFRKKLQKIFDFRITCKSPYKLCDYKPVYGEVFSNELSDYDFWGYCDIDLIFGDIRAFITEDILHSNDKILVDGHISLFRNCPEMNSLFRDQGEYPEYNFQEAYTTDEACYFDEYRGMELKCLRNKVSLYNCWDIYINPDPKREKFYDRSGQQIIGIWEEGKLFIQTENHQRTELMYLHVCKRKMKLEGLIRDSNLSSFVIVPGKIFVDNIPSTTELFKCASGGRLYPLIWYFRRFRTQLGTYSISDLMRRKKRMEDIAVLKEKIIQTYIN